MRKKTCYMCGALATTKEHIPPKAIFPKQKDVLGDINLRKKLITVPSCEIHNNCKSKDDEYLVFCLSTCFHGNGIKEHLFNTKIMRAVERRPNTYADFLANYQNVMLKHPCGKIEHTATYNVDTKRFESVLSHIALGLYFHHTSEKWKGNSIVMTNELRDFTSIKSDEINRWTDETTERVTRFFVGKQSYGENPEVFEYKVFDDRPKGYVILMTFYGAIPIVVALVSRDGETGQILPST